MLTSAVNLDIDEHMFGLVEIHWIPFTESDETSEFMNVQLAASLLGRNRKEYRKNSIMSRKISDWWERSVYHIDRHKSLFFLPTNLPRVSHLDLEQYSHIFPQCQISYNLWNYKLAAEKQHPLVDFPNKSIREIADMAINYMESAHFHAVKYIMDLEYHQRRYEELMAHFDAARFKRLVDYCLEQRFLGPEIQSKCEMIVDIMATHCTQDSRLVVQVFTAICKRFRSANLVFLYMLPSELIQFFGKHLKQVSGEVVDVFTEWFRDEDLMIHAIYEGATRKVKKLVQWEFPSALLPFGMTPSVACVVKNAWPRQKDGVKLQSYYALEYFSAFTTFLAVCVTLSLKSFLRIETMAMGFRTFWRSVPTPYLPFSDMSKCLRHLAATHSDLLPFDADRLNVVLEGLEHLLANEKEYRLDMYGPRSLQHLCRCAVRRVYPTTEEIVALPVANRLKPYLCLDK